MSKFPSSELYTAVIRSVNVDGNTYFQGRLKEFGHSVISEGLTPEETLSALYQNGKMLIEDLSADNLELPEVETSRRWDSYSGKITIRIPKSLHYKLHVLSEEEGISMNSLVLSMLAEGAEHKHCQLRPLKASTFIQGNYFVNASYRPFEGGQVIHSWTNRVSQAIEPVNCFKA